MKHRSKSIKLLLNRTGKILLVLFGILFFSFQNPDYSNFRLLATIEIWAKDMQSDRLGNVYVVSRTNQLFKYDLNGKITSNLNYAYLGNISHIDASNPFELYLFYKELNAVIFLDNNLAYRGRMNLSDAGVIQAGTAARNYANGIWVFDQGDLQLKKIERDGKVTQVSGNVLKFAQTRNLAPNYMFDNGSKVFVNDSMVGILVFDVFANYQKTIPLKGLKSFKILDDELYFLRNHQLFAYHLKTLQQKSIVLPDSNFKDFSIEKEQIYLQKESQICIYSLPEKSK